MSLATSILGGSTRPRTETPLYAQIWATARATSVGISPQKRLRSWSELPGGGARSQGTWIAKCPTSRPMLCPLVAGDGDGAVGPVVITRLTSPWMMPRGSSATN